MTKFATPKQQYSHEAATSPLFASLGPHEPGITDIAANRKRLKFSHHLWNRSDGFTLSGARKP